MDLESFNKYIVMPKVVVYKNVFDIEYLNNIYNLIINSETDSKDIAWAKPEESATIDYHGTDPFERNDCNPLNFWVPWYDFGTKTFFNNKEFININDNNYKNLYEFKKLIFEKFDKIFIDYKNDWSTSNYWPNYMNNWNLNHIDKESRLSYSVIEVLKHNMYPNKKFAIDFHTDTHEHRMESPKSQQFITFTCYLNDNYEGGEIQFINEKDNKLITYKPKAGDITVFPSGEPYWHAAKSVTSGSNKLFLRVFVLWDNPGSPEWHENAKKYGLENWKNVYEEKVKKELNNGIHDRIIVKDNEFFKQEDHPYHLPIFIKKEDEYYIDGRNI